VRRTCHGRRDLLGNPFGTATTYTPVAVAGISNATQVSVGYAHACVRTADSKILCWGKNSNGQFGNGTTSATNSTTPIQMSNVAAPQKVAACGDATCVLSTSGQIACTGQAYVNGQTTDVSTAVNVANVSNATDLSCSGGYISGGYFCAVGQAGTLSCWGYDLEGNTYTPSTVASLGQVLAAVGRRYTDTCSTWRSSRITRSGRSVPTASVNLETGHLPWRLTVQARNWPMSARRPVASSRWLQLVV